jgi:acylphosphatase
MSRPAAMAAKHIIVYGRVQGVGFRYFVQAAAERLGLTGSVCNCPDSTVEIFVAGNPRRIEEFIQQVMKGPSLARVNNLEIRDLPDPQNYKSFSIEGW